MSNELKTKITTCLSFIFTYIVPGGWALWTFVIEKIISQDIPATAKIGGIMGVLVLGALLICAVIFYGKWLNKRIETATKRKDEINDSLITMLANQNTTNMQPLVDEKQALTIKIAKIKAHKDIFKNIILVVPFVALYIAFKMMADSLVNMANVIGVIALSMSTGFGLNGVTQYLKVKGAKTIDEQ